MRYHVYRSIETEEILLVLNEDHPTTKIGLPDFEHVLGRHGGVICFGKKAYIERVRCPEGVVMVMDEKPEQ